MPPFPSGFTEMPVSGKSRIRLYCDETVTNKSYSVKRPLESEDGTPSSKRTRFQSNKSSSTRHTNREPAQEVESPVSCIIRAIEGLSTGSYIEDSGSHANILPTISGKHSNLNSSSSHTMSAILDGLYDQQMTKVTIIDCKYPYEYESGHIKGRQLGHFSGGAINMYTKELVQQFLNQSVSSSNEKHVPIFHCEFSSRRGPKMYLYLRSMDRDLNKDNYPRLNFPEVYLLEGGYKEFFQSHKERCVPETYMPMLHREHKDDLRHFRVKSKSWSAGDRPSKTSLKGTALRLQF